MAPSASHAGPGTSTHWSIQRAYHSPSAHGVVRHTQSGYVGTNASGNATSAAPERGGFLGQRADLLDRGVPVEEHGSGLHGGDGVACVIDRHGRTSARYHQGLVGPCRAVIR